MKRRLFWKILIGFWVTFFAMVQGLWVFLSLFSGEGPRPVEIVMAEQIAESRLASAVAALEFGGRPAFDAIVAAWPAEGRDRLRVESGASEFPVVTISDKAPALRLFVRDARTPEGESIRLTYDVLAEAMKHRPPRLFRFPPEILFLGTAGGLLFSSVLAWYLTRPIQRLRLGFERLARGDLAVRLRGEMGRRRDELADLAGDFDIMAERLEHLVESRDRLLHDVSHELRSPLARLHVAVGLARQTPTKIDAALGRIEAEASRLDAMVGELLTLSRVESDAFPLDEYFDIEDLVRLVVEDLRFEVQASGLSVESRFDDLGETAPPVKGNAELMRRALENILRNAARFSSDGQVVSIDVAAKKAGDHLRYEIAICDQGPGAAPEELETMFNPFVQGSNVASGMGFGLGLAIARRAILAHAGTVTACNRAEGGLEVIVSLPASFAVI